MKPSWTKEAALAELRRLIAQTENLAPKRQFSEEHTEWVCSTLFLLEEVFGRASRYYLTFSSYTWTQPTSLIVGGPADPEGSWDPQGAIERKHHEAYLSQLESARGLLRAAMQHLARTDLETVYVGKNTGPESSAIVRVINLAEHKIRKAMQGKTPSAEKDIQDAFAILLDGADIQYSREAVRIEYATKTYSPDFTCPRLDLAIEIKLCGNRDGREKEIIAEINDDIMAYQTKYGNVVFIVYDLGRISDVERFTSSFETHQNVVVRVVKH